MKKNDQIVMRTDSVSPNAEVLQRNRALMGLTQAQAARLVHVTTQTWSQYERGLRAMHPAFYELFLIKAAKMVDK